MLNELTQYINNYQKQCGIKVKLIFSDSIKSVDSLKAKNIFYIITEAFTNSRKHSNAQNAEVSLGIDNGSLVINIKDNGDGFNVSDFSGNITGYEKLGLISMQQRANSLGGTFSIKSKLKEGTLISVTVPLSKLSLERGGIDV